MKAKVGIFDSPKRRKTSCPNFPMPSDCSRAVINERADRSAPAAKINGFPVMAIAAGLLAIAAVIAASNASSDWGPKVLGRL